MRSASPMRPVRLTCRGMLRVLHLLAYPSDDQARRLSALLARSAASRVVIETWTIGRGGDWRSPVAAAFGLRRDLWSFDVVHVWDEASLLAASLAGAAKVVVSF